MVDIAKCSNEQCDKRLSCYRFTAKSGFRQSYANFKCNESKEDYFLPNENRN